MNANLSFTPERIKLFWAHTMEQPNGCKIWTGCVVGDYGRVTINGDGWMTHRLGYVLSNGPIPDGLVIRHRCPGGPRTLCCNGEHLLSGAHKENSRDMVEDGRCNAPRGERAWNHVLTEAQVVQIKEWLIAGKMPQLAMAQIFRVSKSAISSIRLGTSWAWLEPQLPWQIPQPHRRFLDSDYVAIRNWWREGCKLREIASKYECRVDVVQAIISGKRGVMAPLGETLNRKNSTKHNSDVRLAIYRRYLTGETQVDLACEFGLSKNGMCNLIAATKSDHE